jgi:hypothetical protein
VLCYGEAEGVDQPIDFKTCTTNRGCKNSPPCKRRYGPKRDSGVAKLRVLRENELQIRLKGILNTEDIRNISKRRDALLAHLAKLVAEKGDAAVLF